MGRAVGSDVGGGDGLVGRVRVLVDADKPPQGDGQVGDADGFHDGQVDGTSHGIASIVLAVGLGGPDVEIDEVAGTPRSDGQGEAGEEGSGGGLVIGAGSGGGVVGVGEGDHLVVGEAHGGFATGRPRRPRAVKFLMGLSLSRLTRSPRASALGLGMCGMEWMFAGFRISRTRPGGGGGGGGEEGECVM